MRQRIEPGGFHRRGRQLHVLQPLHHIAKNGAHRTTRGAGLFLQFFLIVGLAGGAHHHHLQLFVIVDAQDILARGQHTLIAQEPQRQILWVVTNGHGGDNFLPIQIDGQRALLDHRQGHRSAVFVMAGHATGESRAARIGRNQVLG